MCATVAEETVQVNAPNCMCHCSQGAAEHSKPTGDPPPLPFFEIQDQVQQDIRSRSSSTVDISLISDWEQRDSIGTEHPQFENNISAAVVPLVLLNMSCSFFEKMMCRGSVPPRARVLDGINLRV